MLLEFFVFLPLVSKGKTKKYTVENQYFTL